MTEKSIVIDTSVLISYFKDEIQLSLLDVERGLTRSFVSAISLTEIINSVGKENLSLAYDFVTFIESSEIKVVPVNSDIAKLAGELRLKYREFGLSTADCIILATGIKQKVDKVLTRDREWKKVVEITVEII